MWQNWLPSVLTAVGLGLITNYVSILIMVKLHTQAMEDHTRRLATVETLKVDKTEHEDHARRLGAMEATKLEKDVYYTFKDDMTHRVEVVAEGVKSAGHRMNGIDMRINTLHNNGGNQ